MGKEDALNLSSSCGAASPACRMLDGAVDALSCPACPRRVGLCSRAEVEHCAPQPGSPCPYRAARCTRVPDGHQPHPWLATSWRCGGHRLLFSPLFSYFLSEDKSGGRPQGSESVVQRNGERHSLLPQWNSEWRIDQANSYHCGNHDVSSLCERINLL